jgi:hypothetical protein
MLREYQAGNRVVSVAISSLGVGTIVHPSFTHATVVWDDGTWSKERYQDLIFAGVSRDSPLPTGPNGSSPETLVGSNEGLRDSPNRFDETPDNEKSLPSLNPDLPGSSSYQYGSSNLNPEVFAAPLVPREKWQLGTISTGDFGGAVDTAIPNPPLGKIRHELLDQELNRVVRNRLLSGRLTG